MMIIDFHTHTFPDKMAEAAVSALEQKANLRRHTEGTNNSLKESMKKAGVDISVILPVVTNPLKTSHINQFAAELNERELKAAGQRLFSIAGIHPLCENYKELLDEAYKLGLRGIKLHPDYYGIDFADIRMKRIISYASEIGLFVITHAGMDIGLYPPVCCSIPSILEVLEDVNPTKLVLAHMGGWMNWDEVTEKLCDKNVLIDTAFSVGHIDWLEPKGHKDYSLMDEEKFLKMIRAFGADRVLFATDSPWADQSDYTRIMADLPLTEDEREKIMHANAEKLLGL